MQDENQLTIEELARHLAADETGYRPSTLVEPEYADTQQSLQNTHLPRLKDYGFIQLDRTQNIVQLKWLSWFFLLVGLAYHLFQRVR